MIIVDKPRRSVDAILLQQGLLKEPVGGDTEALVALVAVAQCVFTPLQAYCIQRLLQIKAPDMVVDKDHLFNSNWM